MWRGWGAFDVVSALFGDVFLLKVCGRAGKERDSVDSLMEKETVLTISE